MNADGVDEACKSNEIERFSGGRVSNTWVTHLQLKNNGWKRPLIPDVVKKRQLYFIKVGDRKTSQLKRGPWDIS